MSTTGVKRARSFATAVWMSLAVVCIGCSRDPGLDEVFEPPRQRKPADSILHVVSEFELGSGSQLDFSFGNRQRRVDGQLVVVSGRLLIDPLDLAATRGSFSFDLLTLRVQEPAASANGSGSLEAAGTLTEQSLRWLQVADVAALTQQPQLRYARFSIRRIGGLSVPSAREGRVMPPVAPGMATRRVQLKATGELELHAFRIPYTLDVSATFSWPEASQQEAPPAAVELTIEPLGVDLVAHGIVPRDARGDVLAESAAELRKTQANEANVTARWRFTLANARVLEER